MKYFCLVFIALLLAGCPVVPPEVQEYTITVIEPELDYDQIYTRFVQPHTENGQGFSLMATPRNGIMFVNWVIDGKDAGRENPTYIIVYKDTTVTAEFAVVTRGDCFLNTWSVSPAYGVYPIGGGYVHVDNRQTNYNLNDTITATATPMEGYVFSYWSTEYPSIVFSTENPVDVMIDSASYSLSAIFELEAP